MVKKHFTLFLMLALSVLTVMAAAQDAGDYLILSAQYGTENHHVDVTSTLKIVASKDRQFRMGNRTFGVDPDHGRVKVLRIFARGPNGQERMFEYREGAVIDGGLFRGWGRGDWGQGGWSGNWNGEAEHHEEAERHEEREHHDEAQRRDEGEFRILSAQYGTERNHVDVTPRLKELARADVQFRMGNGTFGVDPDHGQVKTLRIYARGPHGRERMFEYREGSIVDPRSIRKIERGIFSLSKVRRVHRSMVTKRLFSQPRWKATSQTREVAHPGLFLDQVQIAGVRLRARVLCRGM